MLPEASLPSRDMTPWVILGFLAPLSYALNTICVAMLTPPNGNSVQFAAGLTIVGSISMMIVMLITGEWWIFTDNFRTIGEISIILAMLNNAAAFYLIFEFLIKFHQNLFYHGMKLRKLEVEILEKSLKETFCIYQHFFQYYF